MTGSPALGAYLALSAVAEPAARLILRRRAARGKEDPARLPERRGWAGEPRPEGTLVWLHAASVGEATSALPLIDALGAARPGIWVLLTTGTRTAADLVGARLPSFARHQFAPVDTRASVRRFLAHWRPDLALWIESELWPRLIWQTAADGVPMALVNARISEQSARRWARAPAMAPALLGRFGLALTQDPETADRLRALGMAPEAVREGRSLKSAVLPAETAAEALSTAEAALAGRPVWLAASTHPGEEAMAFAAHQAMPEASLLVLAPRHPDRGDEIAGLAEAAGLPHVRRSRGEMPGPSTRVWLADTLGEMGLWYRLAPAAFLGGSLVPMGGHTPFEPAALGAAILHGPHTENFQPAYGALACAGGAWALADAAELGPAVAHLLGDPEARRTMIAAAAQVRAQQTPDLPALAETLLGLMAGAA
ncbi:MAG: 3-deoxy-D-manno-octulosonic acid transferase [Pseudomonadota bacterium]